MAASDDLNSQHASTSKQASIAAANATTAAVTPRNQRDMLDATFKEIFFCVRVYQNSASSVGAANVIYSLPSQRVVCSALDFLVSFGKVGMRRKKVVGSWTSKAR